MAEAERGTLPVQECLAELVTGWRLRPTPTLTALCGVSTGRVLTTNYDDGIERAAASRRLEPVPLLATDRRMLDDPGEGQLQVVHLHGMPCDPATLVLPGSTTNDLTADPVFQTFMRATIAPAHALYLGLSLGSPPRAARVALQIRADAILRSEDPVAALRHVAVASVAGRDRLRDDVEFTLDLVFEHADRAVRRELRSLDPLRWARTVITRGDLDDAREAFSEIWRWHDQHELSFGGTGSGLRTTGGAIAAIASRWPAVILERRDELEREAPVGRRLVASVHLRSSVH